jgi:hypothetical protein
MKFGRKIKDDDTVKWDQHYPCTEVISSFPPRYIKFFNISGNVTIDLIVEQITLNHPKLIYAVIICNFYCMVVVGDKVVLYIGQASGVDMTAILNSIANSACNRCIVRIELRKPFKEVACMWTYGDDLLLNCPQITRTRMWELALIMFDHERTAPNKTSTNEDTDILDVYFLQRQFRYDCVMMCPLNIQSINTMLQWIDKPSDKSKEEQFAINCKTALMEVSRHGEKLYNFYLKEINEYLGQYGSSWIIHITYEEAFNEILFRALF